MVSKHYSQLIGRCNAHAFLIVNMASELGGLMVGHSLVIV